MSLTQRVVAFSRIACASAVVAFFPSHSASAADVQYGEYYEQNYLSACIAAESAEMCSCTMAAIQADISFAVFAELIEVYGGEIGRDVQHASAIQSAKSRCTK